MKKEYKTLSSCINNVDDERIWRFFKENPLITTSKLVKLALETYLDSIDYDKVKKDNNAKTNETEELKVNNEDIIEGKELIDKNTTNISVNKKIDKKVNKDIEEKTNKDIEEKVNEDVEEFDGDVDINYDDISLSPISTAFK